MRYRPFDNNLMDIAPTDLAVLREVHEGWYVEYKSELISLRALAKALSSFANQYGGWLFLGIVSDSETNAQSFPGIENSTVPASLESLRNAAKDVLHPPVFYTTRVFQGPIDSIGLKEGRSIVVAHIPEGSDTPYVHNDGRIYVRIGDSSDPRPLTDRAAFDSLSMKGEQARTRLADRILKSPTISKGEENQPYIHFSILSDPFEVMGHWYVGNFADFANVMKGKLIPFDNIFSISDGYIARQTTHNDPYTRTLTWEFSRHCHSYVTFPIPVLSTQDSKSVWGKYSTGQEFIATFTHRSLMGVRILDLNQLLDACDAIIRRHRILVNQANVRGPFYVKAYVENVWRTIPFLDLPAFLSSISAFGLPIVQDHDILVPSGTSLETFVLIPESSELPTELPPYTSGGIIELVLHILQALGIPRETLKDSSKALLELGQRRMELQRYARAVGN